jgi:glycosyltransferase involved in cell wall biosynthesis
MKVNIVGSLFDSSGYSSHTKGLANALHELGVYTRLEVSKPVGWEGMCNDAELLMCKRAYEEEMITVFVGTPPSWRFGLADNPSKFYGYCVWEGDKIPDYWLEYLLDERVDGILVPSKHVKEAIENVLHDRYFHNADEVLDKLFIVPHGVDTNIFKPMKIDRPEKFTFLCNKGWRGDSEDRGGVQYLLKAFCEEFSKEDPVELLLKLNPAYIPQGFDFEEALKRLGVDEDHPQIRVNTENMPFKALSNFYNMGDMYVCSTRGEAFNIPGLEAKACGLPTIQTGFGGQVDYMNDDDIKISYLVEDVDHDIMYEGIKWATPDVNHLKDIMRSNFRLGRGMKCEVDDVNEWSWRNSAKKLLKVIENEKELCTEEK